MATYALHSQEAGLVPIVEPEVLLDGAHSFARCEKVVEEALTAVFAELKRAGVLLEGLLLKTSMVLPGKDSGEQKNLREVAEATVRVLLRAVPKEVAGIVFLSGGQTSTEATERLNEIVKVAQAQNTPWPLTFSFSRALQDKVMALWRGDDEHTQAAQDLFRTRVRETSAAAAGKYTG